MQSIKEHNLKANHNQTTSTDLICTLYAIYQRTQFESKSQRSILQPMGWRICMQSIKEHNLKANHNSETYNERANASVCNLSKNTIWKQITTFLWAQLKHPALYAIYQRTQFESKSQPLLSFPFDVLLCMQSIKEHNLKANHNDRSPISTRWISVCNLSKNTPARAGWNKSESKSSRL